MIANSFVIKNGGFNFQLRTLEDELHEGQLVAALQVPGLNLHLGFVNSESLAHLNIGNEKGEFPVEIQEKDPEVSANNNPVLCEGSGNKTEIVRVQLLTEQTVDLLCNSVLHSLLVDGTKINVCVAGGH